MGLLEAPGGEAACPAGPALLWSRLPQLGSLGFHFCFGGRTSHVALSPSPPFLSWGLSRVCLPNLDLGKAGTSAGEKGKEQGKERVLPAPLP